MDNWGKTWNDINVFSSLYIRLLGATNYVNFASAHFSLT